MEDNVTGTSGSDMRALWAMVGTVDFTLRWEPSEGFEQRGAQACLISRQGSSSCWLLQLREQEALLADCSCDAGVR